MSAMELPNDKEFHSFPKTPDQNFSDFSRIEDCSSFVSRHNRKREEDN
ncbi:hypothetical protein LEP1GSC047_3135 [Leptospira inadai serovar Lyme str. 10]|uniref:Uncharacterized protein n=1 Tax=Leptospira inadai serovar Lyme str. 10 TaxID=1049790 RepID=V6HBV9_9LEPT|nr:hypothetical protein LEP1GSC047_3135 [Leptospira inadai serovar Lyme str. 10]